MVYGQYYQQIAAYSAATEAEGLGNVFNGGAASIFCTFPGETQTLGYLFFIEFFVDSYIVCPLFSFFLISILYPLFSFMPVVVVAPDRVRAIR